MSADYHSFLICFHPGHTDVFRNGLPMGVISDNAFHVHCNTMPDGKIVPVEIPRTLPALVEEVTAMIREQQSQFVP